MANRFPLIIDTDNGAVFKELPAGDNLDLTNSNIINAAGLEVNGEASIDKLTIGSQTINPNGTPGSTNDAPLSTVAFTGSYNDLSNLPTAGFTGSYNDLSDLPSIPSNIRDLDEVSVDTPDPNQALVWNDLANQYEPRDIVLELDLSNKSIRDLFDVSYIGSPSENRLLKFSAGAWRPANVQYSEIQNRPIDISFFNNDVGYLTTEDIQDIQGDFQGSVFADDSTLLVDGVNGTITGSIDTDSVTNSQGNLTITADNYVTIDSTSNGQIEIGRASGVGDVIIGNAANGTDLLIDTNVSVSGNIVPDTADTYDLGSSDKPFRSLYLSDNTLIVGGYSLGIDNGNLKLTPPGENPGAEGFEVDEVVSNALVVLDNFGLDRFATMNLGSTIEFEQRTEQSGIEIGKLGSFDNFIGFTEFGGMVISTSGVPATSIGQPGTPVGAIAFGSDYIYYCVAPYDGVTNIWKRVAWSGDTW